FRQREALTAPSSFPWKSWKSIPMQRNGSTSARDGRKHEPVFSPVYRSGEEKDYSHRSGNHSFPQNPHLIEFWGTDYSACAGGFRRGPEAGGEGTAGLAERSLCPGTPRTAGGSG